MNAPQIIIPKLGEYWVGQGGVYIGTMRARENHPEYHVIQAIDPLAHFVGVAYGPYGKRIVGADSDWDGAANTRALLEAGDCPAAQACASVVIDGLKDFYLAARMELSLGWINGNEHFERNWYWSSTQYSANCAWGQSFYYGGQYGTGKDSTGRARAVRRLVI